MTRAARRYAASGRSVVVWGYLVKKKPYHPPRLRAIVDPATVAKLDAAFGYVRPAHQVGGSSGSTGGGGMKGGGSGGGGGALA